MRECKRCLHELADSMFYKRHSVCKDCIRERHYLRNYGISTLEYISLVDFQNGCCAICNELPNGGPGNRLCVDHSHKDGKIRQLLCTRCNTALGLVNESPDILLSMLAYIKQHSI